MLSSYILALLSSNLIFHSFVVVSRYREPQLRMGENYSDVFNLRFPIFESWCLNTYFIPNNDQNIFMSHNNHDNKNNNQ